MQITFITRGYKQDVETFINDVQAQFTQFNNIQDGKVVGFQREQWGVRPIQLWEVFFRDPTPDKKVMQDVYNNLQMGGHKYTNFRSQLALKTLAKALQLKSIPKEIIAGWKSPDSYQNDKWIKMKNMETVPIGFRADEIKTEMI